MDDPRVFEIVQDYLAAVEAGRQPDRAAAIGRYPELAGAVAACLDGLEMVRGAAPELHDRSGALAGHKPLGDFQLVREIGRGGMGVVYEALQLSLNRRVAVKVLPTAAALDDRQLQRFKNEAQSAAQLHHPNIVPVYGVGCDRGVHYYAMQYIEGESLAELIRSMRSEVERGHAPRSPAARETPAAQTTGGPAALVTQRSQGDSRYFQSVARLVEQAARALHHAHERGVIHRDVKPANLLLDARGILWVADFGLAQVQADAALTRTGDLPGTLRYMSPEQARGDRGALDPRTDVYSLAATLYELLTLIPAHDAADRAELLRKIVDGDPPSPRVVAPTVPVDLDVVVRKALAREPADRYATADEFANDLRRFARGEPIQAKLPGWGTRTVRWAARHRMAVAASIAGLMLLTAGLAVATVLVSAERQQAVAARDRERIRAEEAVRHFRQAREAVDFFARVSTDDLADAPPSLKDVRRRMLQAALDYYKEFLRDGADDPAMKKELEQAQERAANLLGELLATEEGMLALTAVRLSTEASVRKELDVAEGQAKRLDELAKLLPFGRPGDPREPFGPRGPFRLPLAAGRRLDDELADILTSVQLRRLRQIARQARGTESLFDHDVASKLRLSDEQMRLLRPYTRPGPPGGLPQFGGGPPLGGGPPQFGGGGPRLRRLMGLPPEVTAVLTEEQLAIWAEMTGPPFEGPVSAWSGPPMIRALREDR
ncbi:MAG: serine/threonine-protein kinase [Gemmataceae bacterium]